MNTSEILKDELIIKVDSSSLASIDKFVEILRFNDLDIKAIGHDEYLIKL